MGKEVAEGELNKSKAKRKRKTDAGGSRAPMWGSHLAWKDVTPSDSLAILVGSDEGGFLSLEEIDGDAFEGPGANVGRSGNLLGSALTVTDEPSKPEAKKRRKVGRKVSSSDSSNAALVELGPSVTKKASELDGGEVLVESVLPFAESSPKPAKLKRGSKLEIEAHKSEAVGEEPVVAVSEGVQEGAIKAGAAGKAGRAGKQKKAKRGSRARKLAKQQRSGNGYVQKCEEIKMARVDDDATVESGNPNLGSEIEAMDMSAWAELRLHPLLEKALSVLHFQDPTPIQKACIPAAAHQGKDVIGAAETGSGKTLAFGIPILQRLLDEQEKVLRPSYENDGFKEASGQLKESRTRRPLRALVVTPTRELALQVCDHLRAVAKWTNIKVMPIVGGMAPQKQQRLLKQQPEIVVGTPGRVWELMSGGEDHLLELSSLSFFVLDEADRMVERGHFRELQSIIDMLPAVNHNTPSRTQESSKASKRHKATSSDMEPESDVTEEPNSTEDGGEGSEFGERESGTSMSKAENSVAGKSTIRRQTLVFSATLALPAGFKKKLKKGFQTEKGGTARKNEYSVASLSERAGVSYKAAIVDLTTKTIVAKKLEESVIECREEEKDAYLYYVLKIHGCGRTLVFCTSISALRRVSALLRLLQVPVWPLHAQMQQKQRLKAMDHFRANEGSVMVATDVAARGLDVAGVRTVIHYQLPHSAEMYVHRSGRTARASTDGCTIALVSPSDRPKYSTLCHALTKTAGLPAFPVNVAYMPAVQKRVSLALQADKLLRKQSQSKAKQSWLSRNAEALDIEVPQSDDDEGGSNPLTLEKRDLLQVQKLQQDLHELLMRPLEPKAFSRRYVTGSGISLLLARQLKEYTTTKSTMSGIKPRRVVVIGQEVSEPLDALRKSTSGLSSQEKPTARKAKERRT